ncbi:MAG: MFS transporter [Patescibacteria group bacterium]
MNLPKSVRSWAFYDFANSSYVVVYAAFLLPIFFSTVLIQNGYSLGSWGLANGIATVLGVVLAMLIGKYADKTDRLKTLKWSIGLAFLGMASVAIAVEYAVNLVFGLLIITQAIFILTLSLSDSILPHVSKKEDAYEYSGFAWGMGYLGGIAALIAAIIFQKLTGSDYHPSVFLSTAIFYLIFSVYAVRGLKNTPLNEKPLVEEQTKISKKQRFLLLLGYWFISEGITVIMLFITVYLSQELHFSNAKIGVLLLLFQIIGFPATWLGGKLAKKFNIIYLIGLTILFWGITILTLIFNSGMISLAFTILFGALGIGNSQSYLRAYYSNITAKSESGFQFGIYSIVSQASVFVGPIIYGYASDALNSQKIPLAILFGTMVFGYLLIYWTDKSANVDKNHETA